MRLRRVLVVALASSPLLLSGSNASARDLTFEDRVNAEEAIEQVYYSPQIGPAMRFGVAVSRESLGNIRPTNLQESKLGRISQNLPRLEPPQLALAKLHDASGEPDGQAGVPIIESRGALNTDHASSPIGILPVESSLTASPADVTVHLAEGGKGSVTIQVTNEGNQAVDFQVSTAPPPGSCAADAAVVADEYGFVARVPLGGTDVVRLGKWSVSFHDIAMGPNGRTLYGVDFEGGRLWSIDLSNGAMNVVASQLVLPISLAIDSVGQTAYITEPNLNSLVAIDLASGSVRTITSALGTPTTIALSHDGRFAYVAEPSRGDIVTVDIATGQVSTLASVSYPQAFALNASGSTLYLVNPDGVSALRLADRTVTRVLTLDSRLGLAVTPDEGKLYIVGSPSDLEVYDIASHSLTSLPGAMNYPRKITLLYPRSCSGAILDPSTRTGHVGAGESLPLQVGLDGTGLSPGSYTATLSLTTAEVEAPSVATIHLVIDPTPDIDLTAPQALAEDVRDGSVVTYAGQQSLILNAPVVGDARLEVDLDGDPADGARSLEVLNSMNYVGAVGHSLAPCGHASTTFILTPDQLRLFVAGNRFYLGVTSQPTAEHKCAANRQVVTLKYSTLDLSAPLDFGQVPVGQSHELDLMVRNLGSQPLSDLTAETGDPQFSAQLENQTISAGSSGLLRVMFTPASEGSWSPSLTIRSNDPDEPLLQFQMSGRGVASPRLQVDPPQIEVSLQEGGHSTNELTVSNPGEGSLDFKVSLVDSAPDVDPAALCDTTGAIAILGNIVRLDLETGFFTPVATGFYSPTALAVDARDGVLYVADHNGLFRVDMATGSRTNVGEILGELNDLSVSEDGKTVYATDDYLNRVLAYDVASRTVRVIGSGFSIPVSIDLEPGGRHALLSEFGSGRLLRLDLATGFVQLVASGLGTPAGMRVARGGAQAYVVDESGSRLLSVDLATGASAVVTTGIPGPLILDLDPSGTVAYVLDDQSKLWRVDLITGQVQLVPNVSYLGPGFRSTQPLACQRRFLTLAPFEGHLPPGGFQQVAVNLSTAGLLSGVYRARIDILSNDPARPTVAVPVTLNDAGAPRLVLPGISDPIQFESVALTLSASQTLVVANQGGAQIEISSIGTDESSFEVVPSDLTIPGQSTANVTVRFAPAIVGQVRGHLTLQSNDPAAPFVTLGLQGIGTQPLLRPDPPRFEMTVPKGGRGSSPLRLTNDGDTSIDFTISIRGGVPNGWEESQCRPIAALVAGISSGDVAELDFSTGATRRIASGLNAPVDIALSRDGSQIYVQENGADGHGRMVSVSQGGMIRVVTTNLRFAIGMAISPSGTTAYSAESAQLTAVDLATGTKGRVWTDGDSLWGVALDPPGVTAYVADPGRGILWSVDLRTGASAQLVSNIFGVAGLVVSPDGRTLYYGDYDDGIVRSLDLASGVTSMVATGIIDGRGELAISPDGRTLYDSEVQTSDLAVIDLASHAVSRIPVGVQGIYGPALIVAPGCTGSFVRPDRFSGTVPAHGFLDVSIDFNVDGLDGGTYPATIEVGHSAIDPMVQVPVTLTVIMDTDGDGVPDGLDNCPHAPNPGQEDSDGDGLGDVCDNCPAAPNAGQQDADHDGLGDACDPCTDPDHDGFGYPGLSASTCPVDDCPSIPNPSQSDFDHDGIGDACDTCTDSDHDGFGNPDFPNTACTIDNCPTVLNPDQADSNHDGSGDACQPSVSIDSIRQDGGTDLEVRAKARDPQGEPLSGHVEIVGGTVISVTLVDAYGAQDCSLGYLPDRVPGEGIGFTFGALGAPYLFDLDSILLCNDGGPDYGLAFGPCTAPLTAFSAVLPLDGVGLPATVCVNRVGASLSSALEFQITDITFDEIHLVSDQRRTTVAQAITGGLPSRVQLVGMNSGGHYKLSVTVTDGNTVPVTASLDFLYQGEQWLVFNIPPVATAAGGGVVECTDTGGGSVLLDGSASTDPDSTPGTNDDIASFDWFEDYGLATQRSLGSGETFSVTLTLGTHAITLKATDKSGESSTASTSVSVVDTAPPAVDCTVTLPAAECQGAGGAYVTVRATAHDLCGGVILSNDHRAGGGDASGPYLLGTTHVVFTAIDASGNPASCSTAVTVRDTLPPSLTLHTDPATLWPPNHEMIPVRVWWEATDLCDPTAVGVQLISATSSEQDDAPGNNDGATTNDIQGADLGTPDVALLLRSERDGKRPGRVYTLKYGAQDQSGNATPALATVTVPHDQGQGPEPLLMQVVPAAPGSTSVRIYWPSVTGAMGYDVITGDLGSWHVNNGVLSLGPVQMLAQSTTLTSMSEPASSATPAVGQGFFYLVQQRTEAGAAGYGTETGPWPRVPESCDGGCTGTTIATTPGGSGGGQTTRR
jgi:sugar lactone lactonase YvrE